jgi:hypothetical protein
LGLPLCDALQHERCPGQNLTAQPEIPPQVFDPVLRWAEGELGASLVAGDSLLGMDQSEELIGNARSYLQGQSRAQCCQQRDGAPCLPHYWLYVYQASI